MLHPSITRYRGSPREFSGPLIWWILWLAFVSEAIVGYFFLRQPVDPASFAAQSPGPWFEWLGLLPLAGSVIVRWLILPSQTARWPALVAFIVGVSLAEGAIIFALLLAVEQRNLVFGLGFIGVLQFLPLFARKFFA